VHAFSENGYERGGLQQPIDIMISDDDEAVAEVVDQFVFQNIHTEVVSRDDDVEAALRSPPQNSRPSWATYWF